MQEIWAGTKDAQRIVEWFNWFCLLQHPPPHCNRHLVVNVVLVCTAQTEMISYLSFSLHPQGCEQRFVCINQGCVKAKRMNLQTFPVNSAS